MRLLARAGAVLALLVVPVLGPANGAVSGRVAHYLPPEVRSGKVFPVARSNWFSVINFANDWHAPRMRLVNGEWLQIGVHEGTDIFAEPGTPVRSASSGIVENVGWTFYSGWRVGVRDSAGRYWFYAHLASFAPEMAPGVAVEPGTRLGRVGNTGYSAQPGHKDEFTWHLHFGIQRPDGTWKNPYPLLRRLYRQTTTTRQ
jgi:murein DD-endopeptidase MepM/ murein hydrolase activator NlpD